MDIVIEIVLGSSEAPQSLYIDEGTPIPGERVPANLTLKVAGAVLPEPLWREFMICAMAR